MLRVVGVCLHDEPTDAARLDALLALSHPTLHARAHSFVFAKDRLRCVVGHLVQRAVVADVLGVPPSSVVLGRTALGRVFVASPQSAPAPSVNIAHSGEWVVCAVCTDARGVGAVGVDVQEILVPAHGESPMDVAMSLDVSLSQAELVAIKNSDDKLGRLSGHWTTKEALTKALAQGMQVEFNTVTTMPVHAHAHAHAHAQSHAQTPRTQHLQGLEEWQAWIEGEPTMHTNAHSKLAVGRVDSAHVLGLAVVHAAHQRMESEFFGVMGRGRGAGWAQDERGAQDLPHPLACLRQGLEVWSVRDVLRAFS